MAKIWKNNPLKKTGVYLATLAAIREFEKLNNVAVSDGRRADSDFFLIPPTQGQPTKEQVKELWAIIRICLIAEESDLNENPDAVYMAAMTEDANYLRARSDKKAFEARRKYYKLMKKHRTLVQRFREIDQMGRKIYS